MLDIQFIRDNHAAVKAATKAKGFDETVVDELLRVDAQRRTLIQDIDALRAQKNKLTKNDIEQGKKIKTELKEKEEKLNAIEQVFTDLLLRVPNPSAPDVKVGSPELNEVVKTRLRDF